MMFMILLFLFVTAAVTAVLLIRLEIFYFFRAFLSRVAVWLENIS